MTPDDWALWRVVRLRALTEAPYAFSSTLAEWQDAGESDWRARLELEGSHNLVALADDRPVGMASGVSSGAVGETELISMYVVPEARGTGVGVALLDAVSRWALGRGSRLLCLDVRAENLPARQLYERQGFVVTGEVDRESPDDPLELRMCKPLDAR